MLKFLDIRGGNRERLLPLVIHILNLPYLSFLLLIVPYDILCVGSIRIATYHTRKVLRMIYLGIEIA